MDYFNGNNTELDKQIIHLFVLDKCTHHCTLCCNKKYSIDDIPVVTIKELKTANMICITGGEPFLIPTICDFCKSIKEQFNNIEKIFIYTCGDSLYHYLESGYSLHDIDGVNISPKNKYDTECVNKIFDDDKYRMQILSMWSNRLYLFPNVRPIIKLNHVVEYESFHIINREWQKDFKPDSGIFRRLPILF